MPTYIALLRGINVGGHKSIKMAKLVESLTTCGFTAVRTYLQSGNAVFTTKATKPAKLELKIAAQIEADFGFTVSVIVRTPGELQTIIARNPFPLAPDAEPKRLHVIFLAAPPLATANERLQAIQSGTDEIRLVGCEIYLHSPAGYGQTKFTPAVLERACGVLMTARNWNTVTALDQLAGGDI